MIRRAHENIQTMREKVEINRRIVGCMRNCLSKDRFRLFERKNARVSRIPYRLALGAASFSISINGFGAKLWCVLIKLD